MRTTFFATKNDLFSKIREKVYTVIKCASFAVQI